MSDEDVRAQAEAACDATLDEFDGCARTCDDASVSVFSVDRGGFAVFITGVHQIDDQSVALRLVSLTDRLYDAGIPVITSGPGRPRSSRGRCWPGLPQEVSASDVPAGRADKGRWQPALTLPSEVDHHHVVMFDVGPIGIAVCPPPRTHA